MNTVGAYDDLPMHGIDPAWYTHVPRAWQDTVRRFSPDCRILDNTPIGEWTVVTKSVDNQKSEWHGGTFLDGWVIVAHFPKYLNAEAIVAQMDRMVKLIEYRSAEEAEEEITRQVDEADAALVAANDASLDGLLAEHTPNERIVSIGGIAPGNQIRSEQIKRARGRALDETRRAHVSGRRLWVPPRLGG